LTELDLTLLFDDFQFERLIEKWSGHSDQELTGALSAFAVIQVMTSVRRLRVAFLPFADRWPRMSGLTVSECLLSTQFCPSTKCAPYGYLQAETVIRTAASGCKNPAVADLQACTGGYGSAFRHSPNRRIKFVGIRSDGS